ncbi:hypothetical protein C9374_002851 [Naegleria lovaniensis]|uniref:PPPDE domain-containing protein n=1 Tax=Naegleria lovaniensis TaxID=51637 RepID=A0AA88GP82_NAELO|nr:uncharacterized protein C9374_002851 [Naegleria lovaniensis]KAG2386405.1 hypothetical protein C9374_002851 [Naegleria lovaniensis]
MNTTTTTTNSPLVVNSGKVGNNNSSSTTTTSTASPSMLSTNSSSSSVHSTTNNNSNNNNTVNPLFLQQQRLLLQQQFMIQQHNNNMQQAPQQQQRNSPTALLGHSTSLDLSNVTNGNGGTNPSQFTPRISSLLQETKQTLHISDLEFGPILSILNQNMVKTTNALQNCDHTELYNLGVPLMFAKDLMRRFQQFQLMSHGAASAHSNPSAHATVPPYGVVATQSSQTNGLDSSLNTTMNHHHANTLPLHHQLTTTTSTTNNPPSFGELDQQQLNQVLNLMMAAQQHSSLLQQQQNQLYLNPNNISPVSQSSNNNNNNNNSNPSTMQQGITNSMSQQQQLQASRSSPLSNKSNGGCGPMSLNNNNNNTTTTTSNINSNNNNNSFVPSSSFTLEDLYHHAGTSYSQSLHNDDDFQSLLHSSSTTMGTSGSMMIPQPSSSIPNHQGSGSASTLNFLSNSSCASSYQDLFGSSANSLSSNHHNSMLVDTQDGRAVTTTSSLNHLHSSGTPNSSSAAMMMNHTSSSLNSLSSSANPSSLNSSVASHPLAIMLLGNMRNSTATTTTSGSAQNSLSSSGMMSLGSTGSVPSSSFGSESMLLHGGTSNHHQQQQQQVGISSSPPLMLNGPTTTHTTLTMQPHAPNSNNSSQQPWPRQTLAHNNTMLSSFESPGSSSMSSHSHSNSSPQVNMVGMYGTSNALSVSPEMVVDLVGSNDSSHHVVLPQNGGSLLASMGIMMASYPCRVHSTDDGHKHWPKIATWYQQDMNSGEMKDLFTVVISKDNPKKTTTNSSTNTSSRNSSTTNATTSATPNNNAALGEGQDTLLDFRNKYMRISLSESAREGLIKIERLENDDVWGFLTTDTACGADFVDELKQLGFSDSSVTLPTNTPLHKQAMGFERLSHEQTGSVVVKRDDQLLLMKFPKYGTEQAKGPRKRKLLLVKYRFKHNEMNYSFFSLFNLRKENSNAAMNRDDIWLSNLFLESPSSSPNSGSMRTSHMRGGYPSSMSGYDSNKSSPQTSESTSPPRSSHTTLLTGKTKRTCDWELTESDQLQFRSNSPKSGRGGVDVCCSIDFISLNDRDQHSPSLKRKFVADPTIEGDMFLVETSKTYDFLEKGFFKIVRVTQHVDRVDLVVRMPRPIRETTTPQDVYFHVLYNMKVIHANPISRRQGKFTYDPIDKEELATQFKEKIFEYYKMYGSQFEEEVKRSAAEKIANEIQNLSLSNSNDFGDSNNMYKNYSNLYVQFTELYYRDVFEDEDLNEDEFIKAVNTIGHETRDIYGFSLLTHYAIRGMKKHCRVLLDKFGMSFDTKDNFGMAVFEWCNLAKNPNNILELALQEKKAKPVMRHAIATTPRSQNINIRPQPAGSSSSTGHHQQPPNALSTSPPQGGTSPRKSGWISDLFRKVFYSASAGQQVTFDEELTEDRDNTPIDVNSTAYDERLLSFDERQASQFFLDKLRKLDEKISNKTGNSTLKSQMWKSLYIDENKTIEAQNAICKDRFMYRHFGKAMENISVKHKDEKKPSLMTVKVIISDTTSDFRNSIFDLFRSNEKDNLFGTFHTGLLIGPWRFDFYDHSIVRVRGDYRNFRNEYAVSVIDFGSYHKIDQIKNALDTIASVCIEYNGTKTYDAVKCNCQHFVVDVLRRLNLWQEKLPQALTPYERYMEDLRKGIGERRFYLSKAMLAKKKEFPESKYWDREYVTFNSRKELNEFCHWLDSIKYFESDDASVDIRLLKSFDRSFCLRNMNSEEEQTEEDKDTVWFFSEDGTYLANSMSKLVFNLPGLTFPPPCRV